MLVRGSHRYVLALSDRCPASDSIELHRPESADPRSGEPNSRFCSHSIPKGMRPWGMPVIRHAMRHEGSSGGTHSKRIPAPRGINNFKTLTPLQHSPADLSNPRTRSPPVNPTGAHPLPSRPIVGTQIQDALEHDPAHDDCQRPSGPHSGKNMYRLFDANTVKVLIQRGSIGSKPWIERHF